VPDQVSPTSQAGHPDPITGTVILNTTIHLAATPVLAIEGLEGGVDVHGDRL
jgi:hypothetical protein